jgi:Mitochondrial biogenesis AIM24
MNSHEIDYKIIGEDIQIVEIELDPNETVIAEAGSMLFMEDGIQFETKMGDGSSATQSIMGKIFQAGTRLLTGESLFMTHFTNRGYGTLSGHSNAHQFGQHLRQFIDCSEGWISLCGDGNQIKYSLQSTIRKRFIWW